MSESNTCNKGAESDPGLQGDQPCGWWMIHSQNPSENCDCSKFADQTLKNGCSNFKSLMWNNPQVQYEELASCPDELQASPPCWEQNGETWPMIAPDTCKAPGKPGPAPPVPTWDYGNACAHATDG